MTSDSDQALELRDRASEAWLRQRFAGGQALTPIATGDGHLWRPAEELRPAAVLVPLVRREAGLTILLTQRTDHLYDHGGQISFPGGRTEAHDESPTATALRETFEAIGLPRDAFEVPLAFFLDPDNHQRNTLQYQGRTRHYYAMPYEQRYIWGATAGMLMNLYA